MAILKIPIELKRMYLADPDNFIRDIANYPQESVSRYFRNVTAINKVIKRSIKNPFDFKTHSFDPDFKALDSFPRFMHFDLSLGGDLCAFSMGHASKFVNVNYVEKGKLLNIMLPFIVIDFVGVLLMEGGQEVWLPEINRIVNELYDRGFNLALMTFDRFQSAYLIQDLRSQGFITAWLSIDRTTSYPVLDIERENLISRVSTDGNYLAAMSTLRDTINQERIIIPYHRSVDEKSEESEFEAEIKAAEINTNKSKIDHPPGSRIDLLQSIAGTTFNIHNNVKSVDNLSEQMDKELVDNFYQELENSLLDNSFDKPTGDLDHGSYL